MEKNGRSPVAPTQHVNGHGTAIVVNGHEAPVVANGHGGSQAFHDGDASSGYGTLRNDASLPQP
ncbi:unnamed protein product [Haemonchus placei]|uniref:Microtubule-associated protein Jupiter n=1 Tax=Haemonchus placei TaxID=6290 RepID=A0A0N4WT79_HAEPC|nr:unnamed protein product [Haemonchus placei]